MDITLKSNTTLEFDKVKEELSKFAKFEQSRVLCLRAQALNQTDKIKRQIELDRKSVV